MFKDKATQFSINKVIIHILKITQFKQCKAFVNESHKFAAQRKQYLNK